MEVGMARVLGLCIVVAAGVIGVAPIVPAAATLLAQAQFQFVISATDANGIPVTDVTPADVLMSENGIANRIVKVEPYHVPVKLTIAVDNGPTSSDALAHYRIGLREMIEALPAEIEVTLITIAPQPRMVARPTLERDEILRGVNGFAPEQQGPRFTDALVEYSKRIQKEIEDTKRVDSLPVLVMVSTTAQEQSSYAVPEIQSALNFLRARKAKVYVTMVATRNRGAALGDLSSGLDAQTTDLAGVTDLNTNRQALIAIPLTEATGGRYEALSASSRLATLLPEFGEEIAALHTKLYNQLLVTAERQPGLTGPLQDPGIELARPGLTGQVSLDGLP
jgi:hypothetical protein